MANAHFERPAALERWLNRLFGWLVGMGLGPQYCFVLEVRGRKSGKLYRTPVNVLELGGERVLVAPRGETAWVRNARAAGEVVLRRGNARHRYAIVPMEGEGRVRALCAYLDAYAGAVQRFFPVEAGASPEVMAPHAAQYPVFRLTTRD